MNSPTVSVWERRCLRLLDAAGALAIPRGQSLDRGGVLAQRLDLDLKAWVGRGEHAVTLAFVTLDPLLPASWGHPESVDQDDGVWSGRIGGVLGGHGVLLTSLSPRSSWCTMSVPGASSQGPNFGELSHSELRRIPLPRTSVNRRPRDARKPSGWHHTRDRSPSREDAAYG